MKVQCRSQVICLVSVKILQDIGASQSLLLAETLPFPEKSTTGTSVLIKGVNSSEYTPVPLHTVPFVIGSSVWSC